MIELNYAGTEQLRLFHALEQDADTSPYIQPTTLEQHRQALDREDIIYLSINRDGALGGYLILALDTDGRSVELRRIVIANRSQGIGQAAMRALETWCLDKLQRGRIWLDVFDFNSRGRHVYSKLGYEQFDQRDYRGKKLLLLEKYLDSK